MKRKILTVTALSVLHFIICIILSFIVYFSRLVSFLGAESDLSDRLVAWALIILLFPIRNIANLLVSHPDQWLQDLSGLIVIGGASILWGLAVYHSAALLRGKHRAV